MKYDKVLLQNMRMTAAYLKDFPQLLLLNSHISQSHPVYFLSFILSHNFCWENLSITLFIISKSLELSMKNVWKE